MSGAEKTKGHLLVNGYRLAGAAFLEVGREPLTIRVGYLVDLDAELPFSLRTLACPIRAHDGHHDFDRSVG